jgi:hypothetical protein
MIHKPGKNLMNKVLSLFLGGGGGGGGKINLQFTLEAKKITEH